MKVCTFEQLAENGRLTIIQSEKQGGGTKTLSNEEFKMPQSIWRKICGSAFLIRSTRRIHPKRLQERVLGRTSNLSWHLSNKLHS